MTTPIDTSREAIERKVASLRWQRSEFNVDDREALDAADALLALSDERDAALARVEALEEAQIKRFSKVLRMLEAEGIVSSVQDNCGNLNWFLTLPNV